MNFHIVNVEISQAVGNFASKKEMLFEIRELTAATLGGIRQLAVNLHPPLLDDLGLVVAIEKYLDPVKRLNPDIEVNFTHGGDFSSLSKPVSLVCYRTIQETVTNSLKHGSPTKIDIELESDEVMLTLRVQDNGKGFSEMEAEEARMNRHLGLVSMKERVQLLNGRFNIKTGVNQGTEITIELPIVDTDEGENIKDGQGIENPVG